MPIPENVENLRRVSAKSSIYQVVCSWIITGVLKPGEKIVDSELAKRFNVSRTPVREAILELSAMGLLEERPYAGCIVRRMTADDIADIYNVRAHIDEYAAQLRLYRRAFAQRLSVPVTKLTIYSFAIGDEIDVPLA